MREAQKVIVRKENDELVDIYSSIAKAAKILFKGTRSGQRKIQKMCSGSKKSLVEHEKLGKIKFNYYLNEK